MNLMTILNLVNKEGILHYYIIEIKRDKDW